MSATQIAVPSGLTTEGLLAKRYIARFIDSILLTCAAFLAATLENAVFHPKPGAETWLLTLMTVPLFWIGYGAGLESSGWQATVGKRVVGLRVYNADGGRLTPLQAAARNLSKDGPFLLLAIIPGGRMYSWIWLAAHLIVIHRSPVHQAIHDRVAETWVAAPESTTRLHLS
jgi:uncharacterized RDD family membrane protein YckC